MDQPMSFSGEMEQVVPWARLVALIEPHYPLGQRGRPPILRTFGSGILTVAFISFG
jgi:hypothetical protein